MATNTEQQLAMAGNIFGDEPAHATPLDPDDQLGLIPSWVSTRSDLNFAEAENIAFAMVKHSNPYPTHNQILDEAFVRKLHREMFGNVWTWAGRYRRRETSIGIEPLQIPMAVVNLIEDAKLWLQGSQGAKIDHEVCRLHHRLVAIHPFANGNGRASRLYVDLLLVSLGRPMFTWGGQDLGSVSRSRQRYIAALESADSGDLGPLTELVRA